MNLARLKGDLVMLTVAVRDPDVPRLAKVIAALTLAYACAPIDLIPSFVPVLGTLDDFLVAGLGIFLTLRVIPRAKLAELRKRAGS